MSEASGVSGPRSVEKWLRSVRTDEGTEFMVRRTMPQEALPHLDPFALFDDMGPDLPPGDTAGYHPHPHAGLEVVSYVLEGRVETGDPDGRHKVEIAPGDMFWMRFGAGAVHYERPVEDVRRHGGRCRALQLWLGLKGERKRSEPESQHVPADRIPVVDLQGGARARVLAGRWGAAASPLHPDTDLAYFHVSLPAGTAIEAPIPADHSGFAYGLSGLPIVSLGEVPLPPGQVAVLSNDGDRLRIAAEDEPAELLLVSGRPTGEPLVKRAVFVMNSEAEIAACFDRWMGALLLGAAETR